MKHAYKFCPLCGYCLRETQIDGRKRLICQKCGWVHYKNPLPVAVCAAINNQGKILITKRNIEPGINKWALPGGFIESGETPRTACLRELKEETGVEGEITMLAGVYVQKTRKYGSLLIIGYAVRVSKGSISVSSELKEAKFVSWKDLPHIPFSTHRMIIEKVRKDV